MCPPSLLADRKVATAPSFRTVIQLRALREDRYNSHPYIMSPTIRSSILLLRTSSPSHVDLHLQPFRDYKATSPSADDTQTSALATES